MANGRGLLGPIKNIYIYDILLYLFWKASMYDT